MFDNGNTKLKTDARINTPPTKDVNLQALISFLSDAQRESAERSCQESRSTSDSLPRSDEAFFLPIPSGKSILHSAGRVREDSPFIGFVCKVRARTEEKTKAAPHFLRP